MWLTIELKGIKLIQGEELFTWGLVNHYEMTNLDLDERKVIPITTEKEAFLRSYL